MGSCSLFQGVFPIQGLNPGFPDCRWILYLLSHKASPRILEWVAYPFSRGSSQLRNQTRVSCMQVNSLLAELSGKPNKIKFIFQIKYLKKKKKAALTPPHQVSQCSLKPDTGLGGTLEAQSRVRSGPPPRGEQWGGAAGGVRETCPHSLQHLILPPCFVLPIKPASAP